MRRSMALIQPVHHNGEGDPGTVTAPSPFSKKVKGTLRWDIDSSFNCRCQSITFHILEEQWVKTFKKQCRAG